MNLRLSLLLLVTAAAAALASTASAAPSLHRTASVRAGRAAVPDAEATIPDGATVLGTATDDVDVLVGLRHRNQAGLDDFIDRVSDPSSAEYRHYLTPAEFDARFAAPDSSVDAVRAFAGTYGLKVADVPANHAFVELKGSAAAAAQAFATKLTAVRVAGRLAHVPTGTPSVPASLATIVTGVEGLDTSRVMHPDAQTFPAAYVNASPCSNYYGEKTATDVPGALGKDHLPYVTCGYVPSQLRSAYGVADAIKAGIDGKGVNVAIIDAFDYPHAEEDANTYADKHGEVHLPKYTDMSPSGLDQVPEDPTGLLLDPHGWSGEQQLDVEAVHAMAPGASILFYGSVTPFNAALSMTQNQVVMDNQAQIVSNSYGGASDDADTMTESILQQAATQGMGFYFSSGDNGDETHDPSDPTVTTNPRTVDSPADQPLATAVGGTSLAVGADGGYQFETGWGVYSSELTGGAFGTPAWSGGGGGGTSEAYKQPDYQAGVVPDAIANYFRDHADQGPDGVTPLLPGRAVPDVAMDADAQTGMLIGQQQDFDSTANGTTLPTDTVKYSEYRLGGTSLASPLFAGYMALADQAAGARHGFANPALYKLSGSGAFHDIVDPAQKLGVVRVNYTNSTDASGGTQTFLRTFNDTNTLHTIPGYDDVTGLGSPNGVALLSRLAPGNATLATLANPPAPTATATAAPSLTTTPTPATSCKRHKVNVRLRHHKRDHIRKVVVRLQGSKARVFRGRNVTKIRLLTPAKRRKLTVVTITKSGLQITTARKVGPCGLVGRGKETKRKHVKRPKR